MANVYKNVQAKITSAGSYDDMYESPTSTTTIIKSIRIVYDPGLIMAVVDNKYVLFMILFLFILFFLV